MEYGAKLDQAGVESRRVFERVEAMQLARQMDSLRAGLASLLEQSRLMERHGISTQLVSEISFVFVWVETTKLAGVIEFVTNDQVLLDREVFEEGEVASRLPELIDELDGHAYVLGRNRAKLVRYLPSKDLVKELSRVGYEFIADILIPKRR